MKKGKRRFCHATDGAIIRKYYSSMPTAELAQRHGLTVKQIENYVYRNNMESWAKKSSVLVSFQNRKNAKKGGSTMKKQKL